MPHQHIAERCLNSQTTVPCGLVSGNECSTGRRPYHSRPAAPAVNPKWVNLELIPQAEVNLSPEGDDAPDAKDDCQTVSNSDQANNDGDALGDACDPDDDNDTAPDTSDICPLVFNPLQTDTDQDGVGDACDNRPKAANPDQADSNGNGVGNACETADLRAAKSGILVAQKSTKLIRYTITVTNDGPSGASAVTVTDQLPAGTAFLAASSTQGICAKPAVNTWGTLTCSLGR